MSYFRWMLAPGPHYSLKKSFLLILGSLSAFLFLYLLSALPFFLYQNEETLLTRMVTKRGNEQKIAIPLFAEILGLSCDKPQSYRFFDVEQVEKRLSSLGIFKRIKIRKRKPDLVLVEYELEEAFFIWGNLANTLLNKKGNAMAYAPYFSPKQLPILYIEAESLEKYFVYAQLLQKKVVRGRVVSLDLREIEAKSKGKREVVLKIEQGKAIHLLRLDPMGDLDVQILRYDALVTHMKRRSDQIIDLRFPHAAYISKL